MITGEESLKGSLERLQLDYVDIVFANKSDSHTPMEEIVRAFTHVINMGWAMYWGTSRWSPMEIMEAYSVARQFNLIPPSAEQAEYHLFQREKVEIQMPEMFNKIGLGTVTWSPLACGILSGKYDDGVPIYSRAALKARGYTWLKDKILSEEGRRQQAKLREVAAIADRLGCSLAQLAIGNQTSLSSFIPKLTSENLSDLEEILDNNPQPKSPVGSAKRSFSWYK
nr:hypothetical protein BaRGS_015141 [Batillaria attramentaria]